ncbi:Glutamyl-tRNA reductase [bacterium HR12]|nr:Glutamyl-tRNA reductase [bacterium HR12]
MALLALTLSHRSVPLEDLERVTIEPHELVEALPCLLRAPDVREAIVLSTCNRVEIYAWAREGEAAVEQIRLFLEDLKGVEPGWTRSRARVLRGDEVIRHLFTVAAGLDSMVVGESEIQGQVRDAYKLAADLGAVGPHLHGLFRWALEAGKRARSATGLSRAHESFPRAAVRAIETTLGPARGLEALVVGNGRMARTSARALARSGARVWVAARRPEAASELAASVDGIAVPLTALEDVLAQVDAAVFATSAPEPLIGAEGLRRALRSRRGRPLVVVDLGLPRNVHHDTAELDGGGLALFDLERLDRAGFTVPGGREAQLDAAAEVVRDEAERCIAWFRSKPAGPVVAAIQAQAERIAEAEVRAAARIPGLDERQRAAVERAIRRTVRKLVHTPTVRAKEASARGDEALLQAARWLFGLDGLEVPSAAEARGTDVERSANAEVVR